MGDLTEVLVRDFRCFRDEQTAVLAPLTLVVGTNSTGKTSFLALLRAMLDAVYGHRSPDFKEEPYDLGSFDEIVHHRGSKGGRAKYFEAEVRESNGLRTRIRFGSDGVAPVPVHRRITLQDAWIEDCPTEEERYPVRFGTARGSWERSVPSVKTLRRRGTPEDVHLLPMWFITDVLRNAQESGVESDESSPYSKEDWHALDRIGRLSWRSSQTRPFASAPVRSKPRRTYDPTRATIDPEGDYVPMYLAQVFAQDKQRWADLKQKLEDFGSQTELFNEIFIKRLGKKGSGPFQVQIRKFGSRLKGPRRNLIDVGYGVSQALPIITEILRAGAPRIFLLQQPEVHLHPSAQAAMGSIFCNVASAKRQLIIETHSDHLIDRVRMDVRDQKTNLTAKDVSILYFERKQLSVRIHSIKLDNRGNIHGEPNGYRRFFMEETRRALGF